MDYTRSNAIAIKLLADLLKWPAFRIMEAAEHKNNYARMVKKKRSGGNRIIHAPHPVLKKFQRRLLDYFFYRIMVDGAIMGFRPQCSYLHNAREHTSCNSNYTLRLDFENAFPSIKKSDLAPVLRGLFLSDLSRFHERNWCEFRPLFSKRRVGWLKHFIFKPCDSVPEQLGLFDSLIETLVDEFVELLLQLTTYDGKLTQGAPTSPYLLNVYIHYSDLFFKIQNFLAKEKIFVRFGSFKRVVCTIYADDITISSSIPISREIINGLIDIIEQNSCFKINRRKIKYYRRDRVAPLVTGLRIAKITLKGKEVVEFEEGLKSGKFWFYGGSHGEQRRLRRQAESMGEWSFTEARLPKKMVRKIRGLIYRAGQTQDPQLLQRVSGYIANLKGVYRRGIPGQIKKPLRKFLGIELPDPVPNPLATHPGTITPDINTDIF